MAYSREQLEDAIGAVIGAFGRFDSYELDGNQLTANFKSNSGRSNRHVYIDFEEQDGEYTGDMTISQSEYYPGDSAGWGLGQHITDALKNPEEYEIFDYEDKRVYPDIEVNDLDDEDLDDGSWIIGAITLAIAAGVGIYQGIKYIRKRMKENPEQDTEVEATPEKDSTVEVIQMTSQVANIFKELPEDVTLDQFKEAFDKAREIDPRSSFFYVREHKDKLTPEMIEYAQGFYKKEI